MLTGAVGSGVAGLSLIEIVHLNILDVDLLLGVGKGPSWWERLLEERNAVDVNGFGEGDGKVDVEVTHLVVSVAWHTLAAKNLDISGLDHLTGRDLDRESVLVKVLDENLTTTEGSEEVDFDVDEEIVLSALEAGVRLLVDDDDDVAWNGVGCLVGLFLESDLLAIFHTLVDSDFEDLTLLVDLLAVALLAAVLGVDDLTLTLALGTSLLHLLNHGTELTEDDLDTLTVASATCLDSTLLTTSTIALLAENVLLKSKLGDLTSVELFKRDLDTVNEILALARTTRASTSTTEETATSATEELGEEILGVHATAHSSTFEALFAKSVIEVTLVCVGEDFVCCSDGLELFGITTLVWVLLQCLLAVSPVQCGMRTGTRMRQRQYTAMRMNKGKCGAQHRDVSVLTS